MSKNISRSSACWFTEHFPIYIFFSSDNPIVGVNPFSENLKNIPSFFFSSSLKGIQGNSVFFSPQAHPYYSNLQLQFQPPSSFQIPFSVSVCGVSCLLFVCLHWWYLNCPPHSHKNSVLSFLRIYLVASPFCFFFLVFESGESVNSSGSSLFLSQPDWNMGFSWF